jgi:hypothetical protein
MDEATDWQRKVGTSKILARYKGSTINLQAAVHLGHRLRALMTKKKSQRPPYYVPIHAQSEEAEV